MLDAEFMVVPRYGADSDAVDLHLSVMEAALIQAEAADENPSREWVIKRMKITDDES
jgi:hypothetical protein